MKLLKLLAAALTLVALAACSNMINDLSPGGGTADGADVTSTAASLSVTLLGAGNTDLAAVKGNLQLPEVGSDDTTIIWSSNTPATVSATGVVTRPAIGAENVSVVLTATITKGTSTVTKTFTVVVTPIPTDPTTAISDDKATLVDAILKGPNADLSSVKGPLTLPTVGPSGTTIAWSSDNAAVSTSGTVTRPAVGGTAATVTLTATITKASGVTETKEFTVTVQPLSSDPATMIADDKANLTATAVLGSNASFANVTGNLTLPTTGASGTTITWSSSDAAVITNAGVVTQPAKDTADANVTLTATIAATGGTSVTKTFAVTVPAKTTTAPDITSGKAATLVLGQANFTATASSATPTASSLEYPTDGVVAGSKLILASPSHNRVVIFNSLPTTDNQAADVFLGQSGPTTNGASATATGLSGPRGVATDGTRLVVADSLNHRVLIWNSIPTVSGTAADVVVGQTSFTAVATGTSQTMLAVPGGVAISGSKLLISDYSSNRVLIYNSIPTTNGAAADLVLGQVDFTSGSAATTASTFRSPSAVWTDGNKVLVSDSGNHRVLVWNSFPTTNGQAADLVIGQTDFVSDSASDLDNPGAVKLYLGSFDGSRVTVDPWGRLLVANTYGSSIYIFNSIPTVSGQAADYLLGVADFSTRPGQGGYDADTLGLPSVAFSDSAGNIWVADANANRVLRF